jgi:hypothetical protein
MGLDYTKLLTDGLMGVGTGIIGNVTTSAIGWGLDSLLGLEGIGPNAQKQKQIAQLTSTLSAITGALQQIETDVTALENQIASLSAQMQEDYHATLNVAYSVEYKQAQSVIQSNLKHFGVLMKNVPSPPPKGAAVSAAKSILDANSGVGPQIILMLSLLMPERTGTPGANGMLDNWTTEQIQNVINNGMPLPDAYQQLQQYFLQNLIVIYEGISLMLDAIVCMASQEYSANHPGDANGAVAAGQKAGLAYLGGDTSEIESLTGQKTPSASAMLAALSQFFVQCTHRLVLSQYMRLNPQAVGVNVFISPPKQSDVQSVLAQAYLADFLINSPGGPSAPADPGIVVVSYNRPSQMNGDNGPSLTPSASYPASTGKAFSLEYGYAQNWYKVCDFTDSACLNLAPFQDSSIAMVSYQWATPVPASPLPTGPVGTQGVFAQTTWACYDTTTLQVVTAAGSNTVAMAFGFDWTSIYQNLLFNAPWTTSITYNHIGKFSYFATDTAFGCDGFGEPPVYMFTGTCSQPQPNGVMAYSFTVTGSYKVPGGNTIPPAFFLWLKRNLQLPATPNNVQLYMFGGMSFSGKSSYTAKTSVDASVPAQLNCSGGFLAGGATQSILQGQFAMPPEGAIGPTTWNGMSNMTTLPAQFVTSTAASVYLVVEVIGLHQTDLVMYGASQYLSGSGTISCDSSTNIAWQQPTVEN